MFQTGQNFYGRCPSFFAFAFNFYIMSMKFNIFGAQLLSPLFLFYLKKVSTQLSCLLYFF